MYVSLETLRRTVGLVDSLAELDDPPGFAAVVLPGLATLVGCDVLTYNEIGPVRGQTRYADYPAGALDPATQPLFAAHVHEHPPVNHYPATGSGEPVMISDFLTRQRFHRLGLYAEFFRAWRRRPGQANRESGDRPRQDRVVAGCDQCGEPHALARGEAVVAALGGIDVDTVTPVIDAVNAYVIGAVRREITERRAERATGWLSPMRPVDDGATSPVGRVVRA